MEQDEEIDWSMDEEDQYVDGQITDTGKPYLKLVGKDGNAFNILGLAKQAARRANWDKAKIDKYMEEAMSGDYKHLLATTTEYFDVN